MKNLKKVFALLVVFTMVLSTVAFASPFADVKDDANYAEAVTTLSSLNLLKGDDKGNFNPDNDITRAEFATVVVRALGLGDPGATTTPFVDVPATHWASGYINAATSLGVLAGYGDGNFGPDDKVTYEQAIKMIVAALGYTPEANQRGGYPTGYMMIASREGITTGANGKVGEAAVRSTVAILMYNALDVPLMVQTGFGSEISYEVMDGKNDRDLQTLLSEKLDIIKIEGIVRDNNLIEDIGAKDEDKSVVIELIEVNDMDWDDYDDDLDQDQKILVGNTNAKDLLGYTVVAYVSEFDTRDQVLFSIAPKAGENQIITITDMENVEDENGVIVDGIFEYWIDKENDKDTEEVEISNDLVYVKNGNVLTNSEANNLTDEDKVPESGKIVLLDNDDDDEYDYYFITKYDFYVVDEVDEDGEVTSQDGTSITFDEDNDEQDYTIYYNGEEIEPKDLEEWDVLSVVWASEDEEEYQEDAEGVLTVYVTRDVIKGIVSEDLSDEEDDVDRFIIEGKEVTLIGEDAKDEADNIRLGNEYSFYLNIDGKVVWIEKGDVTNSTKENYAYLYNVAKKSGLNNSFEVELFTAEGKWVVYETADDFDVHDKEWESDDPEVPGLFVFDGTNFDTNYRQLVTYELDSSGYIKEIHGSNADIEDRNDDDFISIDRTRASQVYKAASSKIGSYYFTDELVIFAIDTKNANKKEGYSIVKESAFSDGKSYEVEFYDIEEGNEPSAMIAFDVTGAITEDSSFFVVKSVSQSSNDDGDDVFKFRGLLDGEEKELIVSEDVYVTVLADEDNDDVYVDVEVDYAEYNISKLNYVKGMKNFVIQFSTNAQDEVDNIRVIYDPYYIHEELDTTGYEAYVDDEDSEARLLFGVVADKFSGSKIEIEGVDSVSTSGATMIEVNYTYTTPRIRKVGMSAIDEGESIVFVREYEGMVKDVIIIIPKNN